MELSATPHSSQSKKNDDAVQIAAGIEEILSGIRPAIQMDGGDIELVEVRLKEKEVHVRLLGACVGCVAATYTLKLGVEEAIQQKYPEYEVVQVE